MTNANRLISVERSGEVTLIRVQGEPILDLGNVKQFSREFEDALNAADPPSIVLDFQGVEYVTSQIVVRLLSARRSICQKGGTLKLCGMHWSIRSMFRIMKLDKLFPIYDILEEALQSFQQT